MDIIHISRNGRINQEDIMKIRYDTQKTKYRLIFIGLLIAGIILGGCADMSGGISNTEEEKLNERGEAAIAYIEEKYNEKFTPIMYGIGDYFTDTDTVECYPDWMDPEHEHVTVFIHGDGTFGDNYFEYYNREKLENSIKGELESEFGSDMKIYQGCSDDELPSELDAGSTIEEFYNACPDYIFSARAFIKGTETINDDEFETRVAAVTDRLSDTGRSYLINVYVVDSDAYESVSRFDDSVVMDAYEQDWKADGVVIKNAGEIRIFSGESK